MEHGFNGLDTDVFLVIIYINFTEVALLKDDFYIS